MATVLASFIGNGNLSGGDYYATNYKFKDETNYRTTKIFGSVLREHLIDKGKKIDSWLIMGTKESIWFALLDIFDDPELTDDEKSLRKDLKNNAENSNTNESEIEQKHIDEWQNVLNKRLNNSEIICRLVGDATTEDSQELIFKSLDEVIKRGDEIVFDVTHGLRNQPIITTFILMYLRYSKEIKIENIRFYYASLDSTKTIGTVHTIDYCNKILKATEAIAIFRQTGNYEQIGNQIDLGGNFKEKIKQLTFDDEMHRATLNLPNDLKHTLKNTNFKDSIKYSLSKRLIEEALDWSNELEYVKRLCKKAVINNEKRQYFKAVASLYEAIAIASCLVIKQRDTGKKLDVNDHWDRNYAVNDRGKGIRQKLNSNQEEKLENIQKLRNTVLHGTDKTNRNILEAIKNEQTFLEYFDEGLEVFEYILSMAT